MADSQWTLWSTIRNPRFARGCGALLQSAPQSHPNSWELAFGADYRYNSGWEFRGGVGRNQAPVPVLDRTARPPDAGRGWLAVGMKYRVNARLSLDVDAAYLLIRKATTGHAGSGAAANGALADRNAGNALIASGQAGVSF